MNRSIRSMLWAITRRAVCASSVLAGVHLIAQWIAVGDLVVAWGLFTRAWTARPILLGLGWLAISVVVGAVFSALHRGTQSERRKRDG